MKKVEFDYEKIILIGRRFNEYEKMFRLNDFKPNGIRILDVGSGVSSFCSEAQNLGYDVLAIDPIYINNVNYLNLKCAKDLDIVIEKLEGKEHFFIWQIFKNKNHLKNQRETAYKTFLKHYEKYQNKYYIYGYLPKIKLNDNQIDLVISSHLLFFYDNLLDYEFHKASLEEMIRICSKEVRIFPIINLDNKKSEFLNILKENEFKNYKISIERVDFEFYRGANEMLRIVK